MTAGDAHGSRLAYRRRPSTLPGSTLISQRNEPDGVLREIDRLGIRQGWLSAHAAIEGDAVYGNDESAAAVRVHPGRFLGYVGVDPHYPDEAREELTRLALPEFKMIKIHPSLACYPLGGPNCEPVWEAALQHNCPVLSHVWMCDPWCGTNRVRQILQCTGRQQTRRPPPPIRHRHALHQPHHRHGKILYARISDNERAQIFSENAKSLSESNVN